ncbi:hypothetical protein TrST_g7574 [Triparma strigata]|uniref:Calmodulin n=1 Tax=Triparma strigata TaxID=1606541 RepID=A0A9W7EI64_9STRA|nr:hypothetical protein TrST_g7574 [Triparma strigata]
MGARGSTLIGKAQPEPRLLPFTSNDLADIVSIQKRHRHDLGSSFALGPKQFAMLLQIDEKDSQGIFREVFDTDRNNLVDAFEAIACLAMLSKMAIKEKVDFIYSLYDFNGSGDITMDEMTILMRTLVTGCAKMDKKISPPSTEEVERLTVKAFATADKDSDGEITKYEFDEFCFSHPMCKDFLDYWRGSVNQVVLADKEVFVDSEFKPTAASCYTEIDQPPAGMPPASSIEFLRPADFCPDKPVLFTDGALKNGIRPGSISNKWFLSALAMVSSNMSYIQNLFVHTGQESHGRYCVRFFKEGTWVNAVIDDQFAFNKLHQPLFCQGADKNEIWAMMVEKAYAKIHGGYEHISKPHGDIEYALKDLTGGNAVAVDTTKDPKFMEKVAQGKFWIGLKAQLKAGVLGASCNQPDVIEGDMPGQEELLDREGILKGWGYPVLDFVEINEKRLKLIKIANPWGVGGFTGDWGNTSPLWEENPDVSRACKKGATGDNAFWMTMNDFVRIFNVHYFCKVVDVDEWQSVRREGVFPAKGGGCVNFPSWVQSEQILVEVEDETEVVITLTQADDRFQKDRDVGNKTDRPAIGIVCHKHNFVDPDHGNVKKLMTMRSTGIELISAFQPARDVSCTGMLAPGKYVILPQTFDPDSGSKFWVTIQSKERVNVYAGSEIEWDKNHLEPNLEGDNEMEQDLVKGHLHASHTYEEESQIVAIRAASRMVAELTVMARSLQQRKTELELRLKDLHQQVEAAA